MSAWMRHPCPGWPISQRYGEHPEVYEKFGLPGHEGVDWACPMGTPIRAAADGVVTTCERDEGAGHPYGKFIRVSTIRDGLQWVTVYAHLKTIEYHLVVGRAVRRGQVIGWSGNSGNVNKDAQGRGGEHLHFSLRKGGVIVDPEPYILREE